MCFAFEILLRISAGEITQCTYETVYRVMVITANETRIAYFVC